MASSISQAGAASHSCGETMPITMATGAPSAAIATALSVG